MKWTFPALLMVTGIAFSACQKEISYEVDPGTTGGSGSGNGGGGNSSYYIKGKKDGAAFNYTVYPMANVISISGSSQYSISGNAALPATSLESIGISVNFNNGATLSTTTYAENDNSTDHIVAGVYNPNSMTIAWAAGLVPNSVKPLKITITAKSGTEISGTFEGAFYKEDLVAGTFSLTEYITVTEGEFKVPVK